MDTAGRSLLDRAHAELTMCVSSELRVTQPYRAECGAGIENGALERNQSWRQRRERWNLQGRTSRNLKRERGR